MGHGELKAILSTAATSEGRALRAQAQNKQADPAASSTTSLASTGPSTVLPGGPVMKGYLSKWTNMARGYHTRWIVLENGARECRVTEGRGRWLMR